MTRALISDLFRPLLEPHLPAGIEARWFSTQQEAITLAPEAEIGWFDVRKDGDMTSIIEAASQLKWLNTMATGVEGFPLDLLASRQVALTNGAGINAITIAEYVVMGMLTIAKGYREVERAQDRHEWLTKAPGRAELAGSKALLIGYGTIGKLIEQRLQAFQVSISTARRTADDPASLGPNEWRARLGEFDWVILSLPATAETRGMIGAVELAAMKSTATLLNISRGSLVDQDALVAALRAQRIGAAFLDVTTPEPLPADHPLWTLDNVHITMHLSGRSQTGMPTRAATLFLANIERYLAGETLVNRVDLQAGY